MFLNGVLENGREMPVMELAANLRSLYRCCGMRASVAPMHLAVFCPQVAEFNRSLMRHGYGIASGD
jgi:hypothetical protein